MPLDSARLAAALVPGVEAAFVASGAVPGPALTMLSENLSFAFAVGVIAEIKANAIVLPIALVSAAPGSPVTGVGSVE